MRCLQENRCQLVVAFQLGETLFDRRLPLVSIQDLYGREAVIVRHQRKDSIILRRSRHRGMVDVEAEIEALLHIAAIFSVLAWSARPCLFEALLFPGIDVEHHPLAGLSFGQALFHRLAHFRFFGEPRPWRVDSLAKVLQETEGAHDLPAACHSIQIHLPGAVKPKETKAFLGDSSSLSERNLIEMLTIAHRTRA